MARFGYIFFMNISQSREQLIAELIPLITNAVNLQHLDQTKINAETGLTLHSPTSDNLGLDSVDILEVVVTLEHHYKIKIENTEAGKKIFTNFGTVADYILMAVANAK